MIERTRAGDAAIILLNQPYQHVITTAVTAGCRQVIIEADELTGA
ncbi:hypothetical protein [Pseudarthrobacter sp. WHRI 8279]